MKSSLACPKCQCRQLWVIDKVQQPFGYSGDTSMRVTVGEIYGGPSVGMVSEDVGHFEAWICAACGFTEWYAKEANEGLAKLAAQRNSPIRLIDTTGQRGPFR